ncbi:Murein L,D-transpeptidase YcbB/YkuD [Chitinophaga terrae (ex Kim and Jung 2007)]|uniref:Murein L,D-transpeptidase YcbB/YkuD n=1 Tax=Chitinophaga terrae (ex Kim and Jung 2007) TaxID=408074 RepID=A0A1H4GNV4_9BACT|nr:L,D-transpeptidase family protein [Chitinophaga terrae (ex Kim and Jung 2007)]MDQ0110214.1 murein L,D-transpeptidase YcbB/YkuD [Chitinophaga terrae (ex Kim and Jung 2007)]SEB10700.1 Murein L,D-transpeptidase YcbB/YkuD [Chitinophaga terrae (ex Kim and Jung 2007)]
MKTFLLILLLLPSPFAASQPLPNISQHADTGVHIFYQTTGKTKTWIDSAGRENTRLFLAYLRQAPFLGLDMNDYNPDLVESLFNNRLKMPSTTDSLNVDVRITKTAIHFFRDIVYGDQIKSPVKYNGLPPLQNPDAIIAAKLAHSLATGQFSTFLESIEPTDTAYVQVKKRIRTLYSMITDSIFKETPVTSLKADSSNFPLLTRLMQTGITDTIRPIGASALRKEIISAQRMFNMLDDGTLRPGFIKALNTPLSTRLKELNTALNQIRWLQYYKGKAPVVLVNIPSTTLVLYQNAEPVLYSRVITGKKSTPTPTLASTISEVILFPYWTVPNKIAVRELLPHIKRDPRYLSDNQYVILNKRGQVVDPSGINWNVLNGKNFPYIIRQNTGCDNSLGIIKLNFYSPFDVYLHDTPGKSLFMLQQRFFSHGCVRVEEAVPLAHILAGADVAAMLDLEKKGSQSDQKPVSFPIHGTVYVFILYNTAWPDTTGQVRFYEDIYDRN